jgi:hypothetical protein
MPHPPGPTEDIHRIREHIHEVTTYDAHLPRIDPSGDRSVE